MFILTVLCSLASPSMDRLNFSFGECAINVNRILDKSPTMVIDKNGHYCRLVAASQKV